jgi:hypothetical protein
MRPLFRLCILPLCLSSFGFLFNLVGDDRDTHGNGLRKPSDDTDRNYTTVGNIALTVSNFGVIGTRNSYWPDQPSCEYPRGSRIEHMYQGGLWVGSVSRRDGQQHVTTGATDRASGSRIGQGYEFNSEEGSLVAQRSSLSESQYFDEHAVSHQDFVGDYTDRDTSVPGPSHVPLGLAVHQESYAWDFPFADFFVILNYTIKNEGADTLDSVYVGLWTNCVVRNTNNVRPGTGTIYFSHGGNGYSDSLRMMYTFDFDGVPAPPPADSYIGVKLLGATPFPRGAASRDSLKNRAYYNAWQFRAEGIGDVAYFSPGTSDGGDGGSTGGGRGRYDRLARSLPQNKIDPLRVPPLAPGNFTTMLSCGTFGTLRPGDSVNVVYGIICARKFGTGSASLDTRTQRKTLYANALLAQQAYDGEDVNGNDSLDLGEDLNGNGKLDHYQLPQPPRPPKVRVEVENQNVAVYWDKATSEGSVDPISRELDFEGYRIYRSNAGADFTSPEDLLLTLSLVGEFDVPGNTIGYNTGFGAIALPQAKIFPGDTVSYWYKFPPAGVSITHLNGWQYLYGVAAFDRGDSASGVVSLQSKTEIRRVVPGTAPTSDKNKNIGVYPNPYYVKAAWDGTGERNRKIYFYNLPSRCEIRIYTLAGDVIADFTHDAATYDGSDIQWFQRFAGSEIPVRFAGGEHAWDLITKFDQAIATGLYMFSVKDSDTGDIRTGKFLVIK